MGIQVKGIKAKSIIVFSILFLSLSFFFLSKIDTVDFSVKNIYDRNGILLRTLYSSDKGTSYPVNMKTLPPHFITVLLTVEDKRFFSHWGVDLLAIGRAMRQNMFEGRRVSGASTITQQLARNLHHYPRKLGYKVLESIQAVCIDARYSKEHILEEYLNRVSYGNNIYGLEAACRIYFGKSASQLSLAESAFLCAIPASNQLYNPYRNFHSAKKRQGRILKRLFVLKKISREEYQNALAEELTLFPKKNIFLAPHFCNWLIEKYGEVLPADCATTLDYNLQLKAELIVANHIERLKKANVNNAAVLVVENKTGDILAMVGSVDFFDRQQSGQVNGVLALRQPGSAIKPFIYALAFENSFTPADTIADVETGIPLAGGGFFTPLNYDKKFHGMVRLRTALACSYNIPTVKLGVKLGEAMILDRLHKAGLDSMNKDFSFYGPGICLGNGDTTLFEMTRAYASFANGGLLKELRALQTEPVKVLGRVFSEESVGLIRDILSDNNARIPAFGENSPLSLPFACAVKTGTSKNFRDNWTIGFTPRYTVGVWVGNFSGAEMHSVSGISGAAPIFRDIIIALEIRNANRLFPLAGNYERKSICALSGRRPNKYCSKKMTELFIKGTVPNDICRVHQLYVIDSRNGLIAGTDCPEEFRQKKVYEVYSSEYYDAQGTLIAGGESPPVGVSRLAGENTRSEKAYYTFTFPRDGDVFKIDPDLRLEYQTISLNPDVNKEVTKVVWKVDNKEFIHTEYPYSLTWNLQRGRHTMTFLAYRGNMMYQGEEIHINVVP